jgi:hypothetical protein
MKIAFHWYIWLVKKVPIPAARLCIPRYRITPGWTPESKGQILTLFIIIIYISSWTIKLYKSNSPTNHINKIHSKNTLFCRFKKKCDCALCEKKISLSFAIKFMCTYSNLTNHGPVNSINLSTYSGRLFMLQSQMKHVNL